jgi:hypothetical protein
MGFLFCLSDSLFYFPPWTYNNLNFKSHLHLIFFPSSYYTYCVYFLKCFRQSGKWHNNNIKNLNMQFMEIFISLLKDPWKILLKFSIIIWRVKIWCPEAFKNFYSFLYNIFSVALCVHMRVMVVRNYYHYCTNKIYLPLSLLLISFSSTLKFYFLHGRF